MYNGVIALILGEAWLFRSIGLAKYALLVLILFHLFVAFYEEPVLESHFGESYRAYRRAVPRWGFTTRPFQESTGSTAQCRTTGAPSGRSTRCGSLRPSTCCTRSRRVAVRHPHGQE